VDRWAATSDVAAAVDGWRPALAALHPDLVVQREFSSFARATIAPGGASVPGGDYWRRPEVQDFDLSGVSALVALLETQLRDIRIAAGARAIFAGRV
jgi:hypothetical protein